jgi:hypothetical protein
MKKKPKKSLHCPVPGCRTKKPHLSSPTTAGLHHAFSNPEQLALWVKSCIVELVQSVIDDVNRGRYFAYLTRWRQPEEMYHRGLYTLFVADKSAIPHIVSGELPNSFSAMWNEVNRVVYDGKGSLNQKQMGLNGEEFTAMNTLNNSAHASFATIVTCIDVSKNREKWRPIIDKHIAYWKTLCNNLDHIEKGFKAGKSSAQVLTEFKQLSRSARAGLATSQNYVISNILKIEKAGDWLNPAAKWECRGPELLDLPESSHLATGTPSGLVVLEAQTGYRTALCTACAVRLRLVW